MTENKNERIFNEGFSRGATGAIACVEEYEADHNINLSSLKREIAKMDPDNPPLTIEQLKQFTRVKMP